MDSEKLAPVTKAHSGVTYKPILDSHCTRSHGASLKSKKRPRSQSQEERGIATAVQDAAPVAPVPQSKFKFAQLWIEATRILLQEGVGTKNITYLEIGLCTLSGP